MEISEQQNPVNVTPSDLNGVVFEPPPPPALPSPTPTAIPEDKFLVSGTHLYMCYLTCITHTCTYTHTCTFHVSHNM